MYGANHVCNVTRELSDQNVSVWVWPR